MAGIVNISKTSEHEGQATLQCEINAINIEKALEEIGLEMANIISGRPPGDTEKRIDGATVTLLDNNVPFLEGIYIASLVENKHLVWHSPSKAPSPTTQQWTYRIQTLSFLLPEEKQTGNTCCILKKVNMPKTKNETPALQCHFAVFSNLSLLSEKSTVGILFKTARELTRVTLDNPDRYLSLQQHNQPFYEVDLATCNESLDKGVLIHIPDKSSDIIFHLNSRLSPLKHAGDSTLNSYNPYRCLIANRPLRVRCKQGSGQFIQCMSEEAPDTVLLFDIYYKQATKCHIMPPKLFGLLSRATRYQWEAIVWRDFISLHRPGYTTNAAMIQGSEQDQQTLLDVPKGIPISFEAGIDSQSEHQEGIQVVTAVEADITNNRLCIHLMGTLKSALAVDIHGFKIRVTPVEDQMHLSANDSLSQKKVKNHYEVRHFRPGQKSAQQQFYCWKDSPFFKQENYYQQLIIPLAPN